MRRLLGLTTFVSYFSMLKKTLLFLDPTAVGWGMTDLNQDLKAPKDEEWQEELGLLLDRDRECE